MDSSFPSIVETASLILGIFASFVAFIRWCYLKIINPLIKIMESHEVVVKNVETIKKEVVLNSGSSLKDAVYDLRKMCQRMENRQIIIDNRSKAVLCSLIEPVFETDARGNLVWANESFYKKMGKSDLNGLDWIAYIEESCREDFINEFRSCLKTNRELKFTTVSTDGTNVTFLGFPYREENRSNQGFLIHLT